MVYRQFSTENADYTLQLGLHNVRNRHDNGVFGGVDGLVIETGAGHLHGFLDDESDPQYKDSVVICRQNNIPVFDADNAVKSNGDLMRWVISNVGIFYLTPAMLFGPVPAFALFVTYEALGVLTSRTNQLSTLTAKIFANLEYLSQTPYVEGRNAIAARKIEEFIAPTLAERIGRKPLIGIIYGAGHAGIEQDLKSKTRRNLTLWNMRNFNFWKWAGLNKANLNYVEEARYNSAGWQITEHRPELFRL